METRTLRLLLIAALGVIDSRLTVSGDLTSGGRLWLCLVVLQIGLWVAVVEGVKVVVRDAIWKLGCVFRCLL